ncbi:MAG: hypothetical protein COB15_16815, partial [Flavobacteriales bacterium]
KYNDIAYHKITDSIQKSFVTSIRKSIERALKPVKKELENSDGFVSINYKNYKLEITVFYLSEGLEQKIYRILK